MFSDFIFIMKKFLIYIIAVLVAIFVFSSTSIFLPNNSSSNNNNSFNTTTESIDFGSKTYLAFGDSITFGAEYSKSYSQMDNPYPKLVSEQLGLKSYKNNGVSGATFVRSNINDFKCITDYVTSFNKSYDIISVNGGVNDFARSLPLGTINDTEVDTIYGSLDVIASFLTTNFSDSYIFFMTPYKAIIGDKHYLVNNSQGYNLRDVANAVIDVANKYSLPVLDLFNYGQYELEMYESYSDGIHPSQEFVKKYTAPQIAQFIKDNYNK